ncbi:hypothetical protein ESCO_004606 [Escovopsis weberi]|uniref:DUF2423 domain-containing protein n=1 Tax=Escovopsis weberi TaxID=150374 RepID=A0A0M8MPK3_ESCWE|nr:hypothetical protein ESCO_004606 [Escovopsis weberi]
MAKSSRSSTRKANNRRLASNVFGPAEDARRERLSAKLMELAKQPKPDADIKMDLNVDDAAEDKAQEEAEKDESTMDVDSAKPSAGRITKRRIDKRKQKKSGIVFKKYSDRVAGGKKRSGK